MSVLILALLTSSCATTSAPKGAGAAPAPATAPSGRFADVMYGQETGLGVTGAETPPALRAIAAAPYALPPTVDCSALAREIASLEELLGPDVDILADPKARAGLDDQASRALGSALRGAIPYRWALRWLTKAGDRDKQLREAVLAGAARRGFLKGMRSTMACPVSASPLLDLQGASAAQGYKDEDNGDVGVRKRRLSDK